MRSLRPKSERQRQLDALRLELARTRDRYQRAKARAAALRDAARLLPAGRERSALYARARAAREESGRMWRAWLQCRGAVEQLRMDLIFDPPARRRTSKTA